MADTLPFVTLPAGTWVDLYAATGVTVGTQLDVQNIGSELIYLHTGATAPTETPGDEFTLLLPFDHSENNSGDSGAWAYCESNGRVSAQRVV